MRGPDSSSTAMFATLPVIASGYPRLNRDPRMTEAPIWRLKTRNAYFPS